MKVKKILLIVILFIIGGGLIAKSVVLLQSNDRAYENSKRKFISSFLKGSEFIEDGKNYSDLVKNMDSEKVKKEFNKMEASISDMKTQKKTKSDETDIKIAEDIYRYLADLVWCHDHYELWSSDTRSRIFTEGHMIRLKRKSVIEGSL